MKSYSISALAREQGLSRSTLLYYDRIGLLTPQCRSAANYRCYGEDQRQRLRQIGALRAAGMTLEEIACLLDQPQEKASLLQRQLSQLANQIAQLQTQQKLVIGMLRAVNATPEQSGLDRTLWLSLQQASGMDVAALTRWHKAFERQAPQAHHAFLLGLGLSEKEAIQVRLMTANVEQNPMKMHYFFEIFEKLPRQGPGSTATTAQALRTIQHLLPTRPKVLDIGCGSGVQTLQLARTLGCPIIAIDNHAPFLQQLGAAAAAEGLPIEAREASMLALPFAEGSFDLLWAEGSIFIIGLAAGLAEFRRFLKPGGLLAFSDLCWFETERPDEIQAFFDNVSPGMPDAAQIDALAEQSGYRIIGGFNLPKSDWWEGFYLPLQAQVAQMRAQNASNAIAESVYEFHDTEIEMYRRYHSYYGYRFVLLQRAD